MSQDNWGQKILHKVNKRFKHIYRVSSLSVLISKTKINEKGKACKKIKAPHTCCGGLST